MKTNAHKRAGLNHLKNKIPRWMWVDPSQVVKETEKASISGKVEVIPGRIYRFTSPFLKYKPVMKIWKFLTKR